MAEITVDPYQIRFPEQWVRPDGKLTEPAKNWFKYDNRWKENIWRRTGGPTDLVDQINQTFNTNTDVVSTGAEVLEAKGQLDDLTPHQVDELTWTKRVLTVDATAGPRDIYEVRLGKTVFMERFPGINSELIAINGDGSLINVDGNGNDIKIDGKITDCVNWRTESKSIHFHWFEDGPYWVAI